MNNIKYICENYSEQDLIFLSGSIFTNAEERYAVACVLMACADGADAGPVQVGVVGGEVMEFGKQRGVTQIPF